MKLVMASLIALVFMCPLDSFAGCLKGDCVNGQGTMSFVHGGKYIGQFKNGQLQGHGTLVTSDGIRYIGSFRKNRFHGKGTIIFPDGRKYEDHFKDGRMSGRGKTISHGVNTADQFEKNLGATAAMAFRDLAKWQRDMIINYPVAPRAKEDHVDLKERPIDQTDPADDISLIGWHLNKGNPERLDWNNEITTNSNLSIEKEIQIGTQKYNMYMEPDYTIDSEDMGSNWGVEFGIRLPFPD